MRIVLILSLFLFNLSAKDFTVDECLLTYDQQQIQFKYFMKATNKKDFIKAQEVIDTYYREIGFLKDKNCMHKLFETEKEIKEMEQSFKRRGEIMKDTLYYMDPKNNAI